MPRFTPPAPILVDIEDVDAYLESMKCERCGGKKVYRRKPCKKCDGTGESEKSRKLMEASTFGMRYKNSEGSLS